MPHALSRTVLEFVLKERYRCIRDVCELCAGNCPPYHKEAVGPNSAGNWTHLRKEKRNHPPTDELLCKASVIWARASFENDLLRVEGAEP